MIEHSFKVVAIANRKGGAGKTTTAVNLAAGWSQQGYKTLLIDLDTQGHSSIGVGREDLRQEVEAIHSIFGERYDLKKIIQITAFDNLWIAPADTTYFVKDIDSFRLSKVIKEARQLFRFERVVIDTPPSFDGLLLNGLVAADSVVVPFLPHRLAEIGVKQLARLFYKVSIQYNSPTQLAGLLPVMYERKLNLHKRVVTSLTEQFGKNKMLRGIRNNIKVAEAFEQGCPICCYAPSSAGCMDYQLMLDELDIILT